MKTLSLIQPWASLIMLGLKRYETRSWATLHRGDLLIHASATRNRSGRELWEGMIVPAIQELPEVATMPHRYSELPFGQVLCRAVVTDVVRTESIGQISESERLFGNFASGRFAWALTRVERIHPHLPAKGSLGLWEFDFWTESL